MIFACNLIRSRDHMTKLCRHQQISSASRDLVHRQGSPKEIKMTLRGPAFPLAFLTLGCLLSVLSAGAPGDGDTFCLTSPLGELLPAPLPSNAKILVDSFNYLALLSDELAAVWQQVDLDSNNVPGGTTSVSISGGKSFCCYFPSIAVEPEHQQTLSTDCNCVWICRGSSEQLVDHSVHQ
jgi:hypothetical protein